MLSLATIDEARGAIFWHGVLHQSSTKNLRIASGNEHRRDIGYGIGRRPETHQYLPIGGDAAKAIKAIIVRAA